MKWNLIGAGACDTIDTNKVLQWILCVCAGAYVAISIYRIFKIKNTVSVRSVEHWQHKQPCTKGLLMKWNA